MLKFQKFYIPASEMQSGFCDIFLFRNTAKNLTLMVLF